MTKDIFTKTRDILKYFSLKITSSCDLYYGHTYRTYSKTSIFTSGQQILANKKLRAGRLAVHVTRFANRNRRSCTALQCAICRVQKTRKFTNCSTKSMQSNRGQGGGWGYIFTSGLLTFTCRFKNELHKNDILNILKIGRNKFCLSL